MSDVKTTLFKALTSNDSAYMLAKHMPVGRAWASAFDPTTTIGKLIIGLAVEYYRLGILAEEISIDMDIDQTTQLLEDWEKSIGIPNSYFNTGVSIADRRRNIRLLFSNFGGVQTKADFIRVANTLGYDITILTGVEAGTFPLVYPLVFFSGEKAAKFTIVVTADLITGDSFFPLPFPLPFSLGGTTLIKTIFEVLVPANVNVIGINQPYMSTFGGPFSFYDITSDAAFADIGSEYGFIDIDLT
jgi:uncharacterized protein YmfQ (DUF2313 family)